MNRFKPTPAFAVALAALVFATAGGAVAATKITGKQIARNAISGKHVKRDSLTPADFRGSLRGRRGAQGAQGPPGPQGPAGPSAVGQMVIVNSAQVPFGPSDVVQSAIAVCPPGYRVVSGGGASITDEQLAVTTATGGRSGWAVIGVDLVDNGGEYVQAQALCAPAGQAVAAKATSRARARRQVAKLVARVRAEQRQHSVTAR